MNVRKSISVLFFFLSSLLLVWFNCTDPAKPEFGTEAKLTNKQIQTHGNPVIDSLFLLYVSVEGAPPFLYHWYKNDVEIPSPIDSTLTFDKLTFSDTGNYKCIVENDYGSDTSNVYSLNVFTLPSITTPDKRIQTSSSVPELYSLFYMYIKATGSDTLKYQWNLNGLSKGVDKDTLLIPSFSVADTGIYQCIVTNVYGVDSSKTCTLSLYQNKLPVVSDIPDQTVKKGSPFTVINLDDYVADPDNTDDQITWSTSTTTNITVTISTDRKATITANSADWLGSETVKFTAQDPDGLNDTNSATFTVTDNDPPIVSDIPDESIAEGSSFTVINLDDYVADADNTDDQITWTASATTNLIVAIDTNRQATITVVDPEWNGSEAVTFTATDPTSLSNGDNATFAVTAVNDPPVVSDIPNQAIAEGGSFTAIELDEFVADVDNSDDEIIWTASATTNITVTINASRQATIVVVDPEWNGSETVLFTAKDPGDLADTNYATFTVTGDDDPPIVSDIPNQTIAEGASFTVINLDEYVTDADNSDDEITWTSSATTNLTVTIDAIRQATIAVVDPEWNGSEAVTFTATDPTSLSNSDNATFEVTAVNDPPVITGQTTLTINEDESQIISISHLTIDDPDNTTFTGPFLSSGANYTFSGNTVTPTSNYYGTLTVPVTLGDGTNTSAPFNVSITVNPVNDAPTINGPSDLSTAEDTYLPITLSTLSVTDVDNSYPTGFSLTILSGSNYTVNGDGIDPQSNYVGALTVPVRVNDGIDNSNVYNISVNVTSVNDAPTISITNYDQVISYGSPSTITTNYSDVDNNLDDVSFEVDGVIVFTDNATGNSYDYDWYPSFGPHLCRVYQMAAIITDDLLAEGRSSTVQITVNGTLVSDNLSAQEILDVNGSSANLDQYITINNDRITHLDFADADITTIPPEIDNLTEVGHFNFSSNHNIAVLPPEVFALTKIYHFSVTMNQITTIPSAIGNLVNLQSLYINENQITSLPTEIGQLTKIDVLFAGGNELTNLPESITSLTPSTSCDFGYNKMSRANLSQAVEDWLDDYDSNWHETQDTLKTD